MCAKCNLTVKLIEFTGTHRGYWVEFSFPGGDPKLLKRESGKVRQVWPPSEGAKRT